VTRNLLSSRLRSFGTPVPLNDRNQAEARLLECRTPAPSVRFNDCNQAEAWLPEPRPCNLLSSRLRSFGSPVPLNDRNRAEARLPEAQA
jgi:hypothetical protein